MKNKRLWIFLGGILIIILAFLLLNFHFAVSNNQANKEVITTQLEHSTPSPGQQNERIGIALVGEGPLVRTLQKVLAEKMVKSGMGEVEVVKELGTTYLNPMLIIKVGKPRPIWTPFFAMSHFSVYAGYASNGDPIYMDRVEKNHLTIGNQDPTILNMYAAYEVNDRSFGLISRQGYYQYLGDYLAEEIVGALKAMYNG